uniref:molybdopterin molybdotransferase n=1 Tax=Lotharella globosa TaxID=91324 RepID=A0A7S3ZIS6_9EUKA
MSTEAAQAFAFRQLVKHLQVRTDVQNIDQMNLAGFCRNCLAKWLFAGHVMAAGGSPEASRSYTDCLADVYGMSYGQWKSKYQAKATPEQMAKYKETSELHAKHPPVVEAAAKAAKKKKKPASSSSASKSPAAPATSSSTAEVKKSTSPSAAALSDVCCRSPEEIAKSLAADPALVHPNVGLGVSGETVAVPAGFEMRVAVLTVSDRASAKEYEDLSGPAIEASLEKFSKSSARSIKVIDRKVVPDDVTAISAVLKEWADGKKPGLILTTGGTGFTKRDVTPEATRQVAERLALGLAAAVTIESARSEPFALLSRAVAAIRKNTLIFNLPVA